MSKPAGLAGAVLSQNTPLAVCRESRQAHTHTDTRTDLKCHQGAIQARCHSAWPCVFNHVCGEETTNSTPTYPSHIHKHARRQTYPETYRPTSTSGCLQPPAQPPQLPGNYTLTAANVTLVDGDAAAVSITVNQGVLCPASLVGTHAATSNHFPHAAPIRRNVFPLPAMAQTSPRPVKWSSRTLTPHRA